MMKENLLKRLFKHRKKEKRNVDEISITDNIYKKYNKAYEYAINMTNKELDQAVEGLFHNLNTLQLIKAA